VVKLRRANGAVMYFRDGDADGRYDGWQPITERSWVARETNGYTRHFPDGRSETYDASGNLTGILDEAGQATTLTWSGTQLQSVTDPGGRAITFTYSGSRIASVTAGGTVQATYTYTGDQLTSVLYADGSGYEFRYQTSGSTYLLMEEVQDKTGRVVERHAYDQFGRGTTSELAGGREKLTLSYGTSSTTVTDALGNATTYAWNRY
jgi:hypothetical protein